ncbi:hypothetical protein Hanom_Chr06g00551111 [Helianthus anomalus]
MYIKFCNFDVYYQKHKPRPEYNTIERKIMISTQLTPWGNPIQRNPLFTTPNITLQGLDNWYHPVHISPGRVSTKLC